MGQRIQIQWEIASAKSSAQKTDAVGKIRRLRSVFFSRVFGPYDCSRLSIQKAEFNYSRHF